MVQKIALLMAVGACVLFAVALAQPGFREDHDHRHGPHRHGPGGPRGRRGPFGPPPPPPPPPGRPGPRPGPPGGPGEEGDHILFCIDSGTGRTVIIDLRNQTEPSSSPRPPVSPSTAVPGDLSSSTTPGSITTSSSFTSPSSISSSSDITSVSTPSISSSTDASTTTF